MKVTESNKEILDKEYASYKKVYRAVFWIYYVSVGLLFIFSLRTGGGKPRLHTGGLVHLSQAGRGDRRHLVHVLFVRHGGGAAEAPAAMGEIAAAPPAAGGGDEALRTGGLYFIDDMEMALVDDKYLVPREKVKGRGLILSAR